LNAFYWPNIVSEFKIFKDCLIEKENNMKCNHERRNEFWKRIQYIVGFVNFVVDAVGAVMAVVVVAVGVVGGEHFACMQFGLKKD
jgi:hypothetical protein